MDQLFVHPSPEGNRPLKCTLAPGPEIAARSLQREGLTMAKRRTAKEWSTVVARWQQSGLAAKEFAAAEGLVAS